MKARVWLDRDTGMWCFMLRGPLGLPVTGECQTWSEALSKAFEALDVQRRAART
jgi:hypothetical protein